MFVGRDGETLDDASGLDVSRGCETGLLDVPHRPQGGSRAAHLVRELVDHPHDVRPLLLGGFRREGDDATKRHVHDVGRLFRRSLRPRVSASHAEPVRGAGSAAGLREEDEEDAGGGEDDAVHLHLQGGSGGDEGPRGGDLGGNLVGILSPEVTRGRTPGVKMVLWYDRGGFS